MDWNTLIPIAIMILGFFGIWQLIKAKIGKIHELVDALQAALADDNMTTAEWADIKQKFLAIITGWKANK